MTMLRMIFSVIVAMSVTMSVARADDGFSVGGVGDIGGKVSNPITANGWADLDQYILFVPLGYTNTAEDAELANAATAADNGTTGQVVGANCLAGSYPSLATICASTCSSQQKADFQQSPAYTAYMKIKTTTKS